MQLKTETCESNMDFDKEMKVRIKGDNDSYVFSSLVSLVGLLNFKFENPYLDWLFSTYCCTAVAEPNTTPVTF